MKSYLITFMGITTVIVALAGLSNAIKTNGINARLKTLEAANTVAQQPQERHYVCDTSYYKLSGRVDTIINCHHRR